MSDTPKLTRAQLRQQKLNELRATAAQDGLFEEQFPTAVAPYSLTVGDAMLKEAMDELPADGAVPEGTLAKLAHEINTRLAIAQHAEQKSDDHRLAASIQLAAARAECDRLKINFRSWSEAHIPQSYETIRRMVTVGRAPDPRAALLEWRTANAKLNRRYQERLKQERQAAIEGPAPAETAPPVDTAPTEAPTVAEAAPAADRETLEIMVQRSAALAEELTPPTPDDVLKGALAALPEASAEIVRQMADAAARELPRGEAMAHLRAVAADVGLTVTRTKAKGATPSLEGLKDDFDALPLEDRAHFLHLASASIGAREDQPETADAG